MHPIYIKMGEKENTRCLSKMFYHKLVAYIFQVSELYLRYDHNSSKNMQYISSFGAIMMLVSKISQLSLDLVTVKPFSGPSWPVWKHLNLFCSSNHLFGFFLFVIHLYLYTVRRNMSFIHQNDKIQTKWTIKSPKSGRSGGFYLLFILLHSSVCLFVCPCFYKNKK